MKVFLIGFMGAGKSFYGKKLASNLKLNFIDLDNYIASEEQLSISEIFQQQKEKGFRKIEQKYLKKLRSSENTIIACGGGTPCYFDNIKWMNTNGKTIFLNSSKQLLFDRLKKGKSRRPLIQNLNDNELKLFIRNTLEERKTFYSKANHIIYQRNGDRNFLKKLETIVQKW